MNQILITTATNEMGIKKNGIKIECDNSLLVSCSHIGIKKNEHRSAYVFILHASSSW